MCEMVVVEEREAVGLQLVRNRLFVCRFDLCQHHVHFGENRLFGNDDCGFDGSVHLAIGSPADECACVKRILVIGAWPWRRQTMR